MDPGRKLDYARAADPGLGPRRWGPFTRASATLLPFALVFDLAVYRIADGLGRQAFVPAAALLVLGVGLLGSALGLVGLLRRDHGRRVAVVAIVAHVVQAVGVAFMLGMLA